MSVVGRGAGLGSLWGALPFLSRVTDRKVRNTWWARERRVGGGRPWVLLPWARTFHSAGRVNSARDEKCYFLFKGCVNYMAAVTNIERSKCE